MYHHLLRLVIIMTFSSLTLTTLGITRSNLLAPKPITTPQAITAPGTYMLAYDLEGQITISSSGVTINLNNHTISGTTHGIQVDNNANHVIVKNGSIGPITGANGVEITSGCSDINIDSLNIRNCDRGINATDASKIKIENCLIAGNAYEGIKLNTCSRCNLFKSECYGNPIGVLIDQTSKVYLRDITTIGSDSSGFSFTSSSRCTLLECRSLQTQGNTTTSAHGFLVDASTEISFFHCLANGTQTDATDEAYLAAGFLLKNASDECSIINCFASNTQTVTGSNAYIYGMTIQETLGTLGSTDTRDHGDTIHAVAWAPDGATLAVAGESSSGKSLIIYSLDNETGTIMEITALDTGNRIDTLTWSPDGQLLIAGGAKGSDKTRVTLYAYYDDIKTIVRLDGDDPKQDIISASWGSHAAFFAVGDNNKSIYVYYVDLVSSAMNELTKVDALDPVSDIAWSPDGCFLAVTTQGVTNNIRLYQFAPDTYTLTLLDTQTHGAQLHAISWSPEGGYIAAAGAPAASVDTLIYEFDSTAKTLTLRDSQNHGAQVNGIAWADNERYLITGGALATTNRTRLYSFSHQNKALTLEQSAAGSFGTINSISWAPHGLYLATGGQRANSLTHEISSALSFSKNCIISDSTVHNTKGGSTNDRSTGINASNGLNFITKNTTYKEKKSFSFNKGKKRKKLDKAGNISAK